MKEIRWNHLKNERLKRVRGISFEEILEGRLIDILGHPSRHNQQIMLLDFRGYIWVVPFIETEMGIFLKTIYPSRKYTECYRKRYRK